MRSKPSVNSNRSPSTSQLNQYLVSNSGLTRGRESETSSENTFSLVDLLWLCAMLRSALYHCAVSLLEGCELVKLE